MINQTYNRTFAISCDWLQIHVKHADNFLERENPYYNFRRTGQSKIFRDIYEVKDTALGIVIAHYCTGANECIMPEHEGVLKFENKILYVHGDELQEYVEKFLYRLRFRFIGVTRFDIAFDFETFFLNLDPQKFIRKFVSNKIIKLKDSQWGTIAKQRNNEHEFETIHFGSKSSNVNAKLYNKTRELANNFKPHIDSLHRDHFDMKKDIWRLEFSLFSMNAFFKNEGKDFKFHSLEILKLSNMYGMFIGLFKKYFRFKYYKKDERKTRMKEVELWVFDLSFTELRKIAQNPLIKLSTRSEKIFIKKLDTLNKEFRLFDENFDFTAKEMISKIIEMHDLGEWAHGKGIEYAGQENYMNNIFEFKKIENPNLENDFTEMQTIQEAKQWIKTN